MDVDEEPVEFEFVRVAASAAKELCGCCCGQIIGTSGEDDVDNEEPTAWRRQLSDMYAKKSEKGRKRRSKEEKRAELKRRESARARSPSRLAAITQLSSNNLHVVEVNRDNETDRIEQWNSHIYGFKSLANVTLSSLPSNEELQVSLSQDAGQSPRWFTPKSQPASQSWFQGKVLSTSTLQTPASQPSRELDMIQIVMQDANKSQLPSPEPETTQTNSTESLTHSDELVGESFVCNDGEISFTKEEAVQRARLIFNHFDIDRSGAVRLCST